jgi:hypothetical protein
MRVIMMALDSPAKVNNGDQDTRQPPAMLAWNPKHGIPAGLMPPPVAEEGPRNYHRDKYTGLRLGKEGASMGV